MCALVLGTSTSALRVPTLQHIGASDNATGQPYSLYCWAILHVLCWTLSDMYYLQDTLAQTPESLHYVIASLPPAHLMACPATKKDGSCLTLKERVLG